MGILFINKFADFLVDVVKFAIAIVSCCFNQCAMFGFLIFIDGFKGNFAILIAYGIDIITILVCGCYRAEFACVDMMIFANLMNILGGAASLCNVAIHDEHWCLLTAST